MLVSYLVLPSSARDRRSATRPGWEMRPRKIDGWNLLLGHLRHFMDITFAWVPKHPMDEALKTHYGN